MRIGKPIREVTTVPKPTRAPTYIPIPERETVPVRRTPIKEPARRALGRSGMIVEEIPYGCPQCGREMDMEDGVLSCPQHGIVYEY